MRARNWGKLESEPITSYNIEGMEDEMSILDIIILAVFAYCLLSGIYKGSLASGLALIGFAGAWYGAQMLYSSVATLALSNSTLMAVLSQYLEPATFFSDSAIASATITEVLSGGESSISAVVNSVAENFSFISEALSANIRTQAFANLGISSMADYFNQTLWVAVFNVGAFILTFIALYAVLSILISLMDHVIRFPVMRSFDWLCGGVFGLLRATVVVVLLLNVLPALSNIVSPELTENLLSQSSLYALTKQLDLLGVAKWIGGLVRG